MNQQNSITVAELIMVLTLLPPDNLISFSSEYTLDSKRAWDRFSICSCPTKGGYSYPVLDINIHHGNVTDI